MDASIAVLPAGSSTVDAMAIGSAYGDAGFFDDAFGEWSFVIDVAGPGDADFSGSVDFGDVLAVLDAWGRCDACEADLGLDDLLEVLAHFG